MLEWEVARQCVLLRGLSDEEVERVLAIAQKRVYQPGEALFKQGENSSQVFVVTDGMVRVSQKQGDKEITLVHLGAGQLVGEMALVSGGAHSASVEAVEAPTEALVFEVEKLLALFEAEPRIGYHLMRNIASDMAFKIRHHNLKMLV